MAGIFGYVPNNTLGALYLTPQTGNEARWRQALANQGSISKARPSLGGRLENLTVDTLRRAGVSDRAATRLGSKTFSAVNDLTPVGNLTGADEGAAQFGRGLTRGDLGQAALGAGVFGLSVFPGAAGRVVGKVGKGMFGRLMRDESGAIRAWHGSPHDFDKFSLSKIGTGEGAQAYGHGLYFAENRKVAEEYQRQLSGGTLRTQSGEILDPYNLMGDAKLAAQFLIDAGGNAAVAKKIASETYAGPQPYRIAQQIDALIGSGVRPSGAGRLYEVDIKANPNEFLDWDAGLRDQPPPVLGALQELGIDPVKHTIVSDGGRAYGSVSMLHGDREGASRELYRHGIPGIRYLDQGSRIAGEGSRNYVAFDDSLIDILNKY